MTSSRRLAFALVLAAASLSGAAAHAQAHPPTAQELETARTLYKEGKELRAQGDLRGALEKLQAAHALGNTPVTGIELARTYVLVGQIVEAREVCLYIARMPTAGDETEKSVEARTEAAHLAEELRPRIPTLRVKIEGLPADESAHLSIDGVSVPDAALTEPQKVDPGKHTVAIRVGEGPTAREARGAGMVNEGQAGEVTLTVPPKPAVVVPVVGPDAPQPRPSRTGPLLVKIGFGTAIAGGSLALIAGFSAINKANGLAGECPYNHCPPGTPTSDLEASRTWATVTNVAVVIGSAGVVVGIIGLWRSRSTTARIEGASLAPWIGVGAAGLDGRF
jgi:hypothetical protein